ncbi:uncharacterized protein DUF742 [Stackebrandtia albiflava]|uniref:Uncharacterized protein DUF742 n=1 Tax=Stackebrandtia albiflava TaxID=406432 RepID=A0A562VCH7_9ACTN|nr:DUF742 domain-containing protein [Stackebrandtia albiflava]TWJ15584.1 uncharacterized protein DUF742 [Stackebrandtia albiflava]
MPRLEEEQWYDDDAGRLVRPFLVTRGRTAPTVELDLLSLVQSTGAVEPTKLDLDHAHALQLCTMKISVAEVAGLMRLPATVTKVLLADLIDAGALLAHEPLPAADPEDLKMLEALLHGLQQRF